LSRPKTTASIFEIERYATKDGPGIRTVVFFKGCNLRCAWCQNPESQRFEKEIMYYINACVKCGKCLEACPNNAIRYDETYGFISNPDRCSACGLCVDQCLYGARALMGTEYTPEGLFEIVKKDLDFYQESGGGITVSGGEPLLNPDFLVEFFTLCKSPGIHIAIETAGNVPWETFEKVMPFTDLFFFDVKHIDDEVHQFWTGVSNKNILKNLERLASTAPNIIIRTPVIPGVNDDEAVLERIFYRVNDLNITTMELLPYHRLGLSKYRGLGRAYKLASIESMELSELEKYVALGKKMGLNVSAGAI